MKKRIGAAVILASAALAIIAFRGGGDGFGFLGMGTRSAAHGGAGADLPSGGAPITVLVAGDAMMDGSVKQAIRKRGVDDPFRQVKDEVLKADWAIVNLETSVTNATVKDGNQLFNFKSDPSSLKGLKNAGFDMVSLANNHVLDYRERGLRDTIKYVSQSGLAYAGAGLNEEEAYRAKTIVLKGQKVKIAAYTRFMPTTAWIAGADSPGVAGAYDQERVLRAIREQAPDSDYFIVYIHWGIEKNNRPEAWQREFAKRMLDAGADAIVGSHPHVLQGFEFYKGKPIAYSIGNFLFPDYVKGRKADTGLLKLKLRSGKVGIGFYPYSIRDNRVVKRDSAYRKKQLHYIQSLSYDVFARGNAFTPAVPVTGK